MDGRQCQNCRYWERNRVSSTSHGKCKPSALDAIRPTKAQNRMWLFAQEYIVDLNATRAAVRAGYAERHAAAIASKLLRKVNVEYWIDEAQELKARSRNITVDRVLPRLGWVQDTDSLTTEHTVASPLRRRRIWSRSRVAGCRYRTPTV